MKNYVRMVELRCKLAGKRTGLKAYWNAPKVSFAKKKKPKKKARFKVAIEEITNGNL